MDRKRPRDSHGSLEQAINMKRHKQIYSSWEMGRSKIDSSTDPYASNSYLLSHAPRLKSYGHGLASRISRTPPLSPPTRSSSVSMFSDSGLGFSGEHSVYINGSLTGYGEPIIDNDNNGILVAPERIPEPMLSTDEDPPELRTRPTDEEHLGATKKVSFQGGIGSDLTGARELQRSVTNMNDWVSTPSSRIPHGRFKYTISEDRTMDLLKRRKACFVALQQPQRQAVKVEQPISRNTGPRQSTREPSEVPPGPQKSQPDTTSSTLAPVYLSKTEGTFVSSKQWPVYYCQEIDCRVSFHGRYAKGNLARHRRRKHSSHQVVLYVCGEPGCSKSYKRLDALSKHRHVYHLSGTHIMMR